MGVKRVYVEKKPEFAVQAKELRHEVKSYLGIKTVKNVRVLIRYDGKIFLMQHLKEHQRCVCRTTGRCALQRGLPARRK